MVGRMVGNLETRQRSREWTVEGGLWSVVIVSKQYMLMLRKLDGYGSGFG